MEDPVLERLSCEGCGASLEYSAGARALKCRYCNAVTAIAGAAGGNDEPAVDGPKMIVPLTVEQRELEHAVRALLASGNYTPDDLLTRAVFTRIERFYAAAWVFNGQYQASWTASFGYDRTEHYTDYETRYENGETRQVPVTKTRTVTDWIPASGTDSGTFSIVGYAGKRLPDDAIKLVEEGTGRELTSYRPAYAAGIEIEGFALDSEASYLQRAKPRLNKLIDRRVMSHAQGSQQRDWHWSANIVKDAISVAIPVCHVVYEYGGRTYEVWTDGTDATRQVFDPLPKDRRRRMRVWLGFIPGLTATAALLLAGSLNDISGVPPVLAWSAAGAVAAAWGFGLWRRHAILGQSRRLRQALLAEKQ